jgi:hypothetical protein
MNVPDWLWQNIVSDLLADGLKVAAIGLSAWMYRKMRLMQRRPILLSGAIEGGSHLSGELSVGGHTRTVSDNIGVTDNVLVTLNKGTPSLASRLEELALWYLRVS